MKKLIIITLTLLLMISMISCSDLNKSDLNIKDHNNDNDVIFADINKDDDISYPANEKNSIVNSSNVDDDTSNSANNKASIGGSGGCTIHNFAYHYFPDALIKYIGAEKFYEWVELDDVNVLTDDGCYQNSNVLTCAQYFNIPNDVLIDIYQNEYYVLNWNMLALLSRNAVEFESYARLESTKTFDAKMSSEQMLKITLFDMMSTKTDDKTVDYYNKVTNSGTYYPYCELSIVDLITNTSLTKEDFEKACGLASSDNGEYLVHPHFEYNIDLLFGDTNALMNIMNNDAPEAYESNIKHRDSLLHIGEDNNYELY